MLIFFFFFLSDVHSLFVDFPLQVVIKRKKEELDVFYECMRLRRRIFLDGMPVDGNKIYSVNNCKDVANQRSSLTTRQYASVQSTNERKDISAKKKNLFPLYDFNNKIHRKISFLNLFIPLKEMCSFTLLII